jgi:hypothetical protein
VFLYAFDLLELDGRDRRRHPIGDRKTALARAVTDLLLQKAQAVRAGAQGDEDYDVIGPDGIVIGRIFEATTSPIGTPWMSWWERDIRGRRPW